MAAPAKRSRESRAPTVAVGAIALVAVCCGGHALVLAALGGAAIGGAAGIGAGVLAVVVIVTAAVFVRRRRAGSCQVDWIRRLRRER